MRVTNLILHIIAVILMLPDLLFVGINTLMGLPYFDGAEFLIVGVADLVLCAALATSTIWEIIMVIKYRSTRPIVYMICELVIHGISALWFGLAIAYIIRVHLTSTYSHDFGFSMYINLAGFILCVVAIILNLIFGIRRNIKIKPQ